MTAPLVRLTAAVAASLLVTTVAAGQSRIELTPFVGGFLPTGSLGRAAIPGPGGSSVSATVEMKTAGALGARLSYSGAGRLGVEGEYFFAASDMRVALGPFPAVVDADVQGGGVKLTYRATSEQSGTDLTLAAGIGGISHGGTAFRLGSSQFDLAGMAGAGLRVDVSPLVTLRFDGTLYGYSWSYGLPGFGSSRQFDALVTAGLAIKMGR